MRKLRFSTLLCAAGVMLLGASCSPQALPLSLEMRHPSRSGLDLARKTFAVVYEEEGNASDSLFSEKMASSFASRLEADYFGGEQMVCIYKIPVGAGDYTSRDSLISLAMTSGEDVVFLFEKTKFGEPQLSSATFNGQGASRDSAYRTTVQLPVTVTMRAYDTMNKEDKVFNFSGSNVIRPVVYHDGSLIADDIPDAIWPYVGKQAENVGYQAGASFQPVWKNEEFTIIYYDSFNDAWTDAAMEAYECKWDTAIAKWMTLLKTNNLKKRSCAEYNIALGCFMMGQKDLALKWLDQSDKDYPISLSKSLRKRIGEQ